MWFSYTQIVFNIPRGTRDFTPEDMQKRRYLEKSMRDTFNSFGYGEVQTPMFENLDLFTAKSGEGIIDEIYSFQDKSGRNLALRPELTAPVMRFYVEKMQMEPKPLKLFYFGNCFRYDRPQKGRYREFMQAGCELIGTNTPEAQAELIAMAYKLLENAGLKTITLSIGNLNILSVLFEKLGLSKENQKYLIPLIDKSQFEGVYDALVDFKVKPKDATVFLEILQSSDVKKISEYLKDNEIAKKELNGLKTITDLLENAFDVKDYEIKMSIVRGLDYYKGLVFEIEAACLGAEKQLCGGGAYDLIELFGGRESPTSGFAIGFDRTLIALETEGYKFTIPQLDAYLVSVNDDTLGKTLEIAQMLRNQGISTDMDLLRRGIGKSLKYASSINAKNAIIVGPKELEQDSVTIKNMETGDQQTVKIKDIVSKVK